jgi:adenosylmethionine-8-amino-7-oxononanoate aminotransferase
MAAVQLDPDDPCLAPRVAAATRRKGVIVRPIVGNGLQISPPLIITPQQVDELVTGLEDGLRSL